MGEWRYSSTILDPGTRWRWVVSSTSRPFYPMDKRLSEPQCRPGLYEEKNLASVANPTPAVGASSYTDSRILTNRSLLARRASVRLSAPKIRPPGTMLYCLKNPSWTNRKIQNYQIQVTSDLRIPLPSNLRLFIHCHVYPEIPQTYDDMRLTIKTTQMQSQPLPLFPISLPLHKAKIM
jgi:hypothetical protein